jgi:hypothetical protein
MILGLRGREACAIHTDQTRRLRELIHIFIRGDLMATGREKDRKTRKKHRKNVKRKKTLAKARRGKKGKKG